MDFLYFHICIQLLMSHDINSKNKSTQKYTQLKHLKLILFIQIGYNYAKQI